MSCTTPRRGEDRGGSRAKSIEPVGQFSRFGLCPVAHVDDLVLPRGTARVVSAGGRWLAMTASENGPPWYIGHANDVSLAVAARDAAIERADQ